MTTLIPKFDFKNGGSTPAGAVNRPINEKLAEIVSVKDFGAIGNGTTDDTVAIQNAIDNSPIGSNIYFPTGTYLITGLTIVNSVTLSGNGLSSVIKCNTTGIGVNVDITATGPAQQLERIAISCLSFVEGASIPSAFITNTESVNLLIEKCYFVDCSVGWCIDNVVGYGTIIRECIFNYVTGNGVQFQDNGAAPKYSYVTRVIDCDFSGIVNAVIANSGQAYFESCIFEGCSSKAVQVGVTFNAVSVTFQNCYWEANTGVDLDLTSTNTTSVIVSNCNFIDSPSIDLGTKGQIVIIGYNGGGGGNVCSVVGSSDAQATLIDSINYAQSGSYIWKDLSQISKNANFKWSGTSAFSTGINVNVGAYGATAMALVSRQQGGANPTGSAIYMLRFGFSGDIVNATLVSSDDNGGTVPMSYTFTAVSSLLNITSANAGNSRCQLIFNIF